MRTSFPGSCSELITWIGAPDLIRTSDLLLRRQTLYPAELRVHVNRFYRTAMLLFWSQVDPQGAGRGG